MVYMACPVLFRNDLRYGKIDVPALRKLPFWAKQIHLLYNNLLFLAPAARKIHVLKGPF